ncbi:DUF72 domain-containing protein [Diaminobutyricimonas sp. LJ205]|uniref:DUF72 domain-containing protein n=1 Tax=Diaminobutyricimonas sp. LJ205 TaxID=2683590 RepID=UPI0012F4D489|nr:DUF72 domain-containing protein [Diaminobutyricimonas sp. LJ205]
MAVVDGGAVARIGISGWRYPAWRGTFYPPKLPQRLELEYAADRLTSIEINGTFYSLQKPAYFTRWAAETPDQFRFAVKGGRYITHLLRLREPQQALANFFASGLLALGPKLGPVLWQLPPNLSYAPETLERFLTLLPTSTGQAATLGRQHEDRLDGRVHLDIDADRPLRHAIEVRHPSFDTAEYFAQLAAHQVASVVADTAGKWPKLTAATTDFVYVRLHGDTVLYESGYDDAALDGWASMMRGWLAEGRDVWAYFDNDVKVRAPFDAMALIQRLA